MPVQFMTLYYANWAMTQAVIAYLTAPQRTKKA